MTKSQAKYTAYKTAWDQKNTRQYKLKLNKRTDEDIINWLDDHENKQEYIKRLIREDIRRVNDGIAEEELHKLIDEGILPKE